MRGGRKDRFLEVGESERIVAGVVGGSGSVGIGTWLGVRLGMGVVRVVMVTAAAAGAMWRRRIVVIGVRSVPDRVGVERLREGHCGGGGGDGGGAGGNLDQVRESEKDEDLRCFFPLEYYYIEERGKSPPRFRYRRYAAVHLL